MASVASVGAIVGPLGMTQVLAAGAEHGFAGSAFLAAAALVSAALAVVYFRVLGQPAAAASSAG
jgi:DHA1 family tetracycline resistance protein-like MFS transporter